MKNKTSITALMSAFGRAYHVKKAADVIFADTKANELISSEEYQSISRHILSGIDFLAPEKKNKFTDDEEALQYLVNTQIAPTPLARAKFCEDELKTALESGTEQYVILGAGMDTFALRQPDLSKKYEIFEVDHPLTQADKIKRIQSAGLKIPCNLHFAPVNFLTDSLKENLLKAGFNPEKSTFFSFLGVSYYLTGEQIDSMLENIRALSARGSSLVLDYADEGLFNSNIKRVQNMTAMAAAGGEPMKTCFNAGELEKLLKRYHFSLQKSLTPANIQSRYFAHRNDELTAFEHINYALFTLK